MSQHITASALSILLLLQTACSNSTQPASQQTQTADSDTSEITPPPAGDITHYGAVSLGDEGGMLSDLLASFYRLDSGVDNAYISSLFSGANTSCTVQNDEQISFDNISVGFVPSVPGVGQTAVQAGDNITLSSQGGTFSSLQLQTVADFLFYDVPTDSMLADTPIPEHLIVDIPGSLDIPAFTGVTVPQITSFASPDLQASDTVTVGSTISWPASNDPDALIRISSSTAGGFFLENSVSVSCLTPDTGSFTFPTETRQTLGADFTGSAAIVSRVVIDTVQQENTILFLIRESFL